MRRDADATSSADWAARWNYLFPCCRFAHYLKCITRDKIGVFMEREDMQQYLYNWISQYINEDHQRSTDATNARFPLAEARIVVDEDEGKPGYYVAQIYLRPHYQLEGPTASLRLTTHLPNFD